MFVEGFQALDANGDGYIDPVATQKIVDEVLFSNGRIVPRNVSRWTFGALIAHGRLHHN
jgi:hypothetical protein